MQYQPALEKRNSRPADDVSAPARAELSDAESAASSRSGFRYERFSWPALIVSLALAYACATGPFRAPDEPHHFFRAYEVSEGHLVAAKPGGGFVGDWLPHSLDRTVLMLGGYPFVPPVRVDRAAMAKAWTVKLKSHRNFVPFPGAALHSPLAYLPAALGITFGKMGHARPLILFYLARCANAIVGGGLIGLALARIWRRAPYIATIALFPMCLFQVGSLTSDAVTFAISFFWVSEVLRARTEAGFRLSRVRWILIAAALSQLRFPFPFLGLLVFAVPSHSIDQHRAARWRFFPIFFAALVLPCLLWIYFVQGLRVQLRPDGVVDPGQQLQFIVSHPLQFFHIFGASLHQFGYDFWRQMIGVFGWLNLPLPTWLLGAVTLALVVTICSAETRVLRLTLPIRSAFFSLGTCILMLTATIIYMAWNSVGAPRIEGWQGRYAIPVLPLLATALANERLRRARWLWQGAIAFSVLANVFAIIFLARATWS
ncbi:MAG: DUF2142 domain-containing protein [Spartobacteria bacterium]